MDKFELRKNREQFPLVFISGRQVQDRGDLQRERVQAAAGAAQGRGPQHSRRSLQPGRALHRRTQVHPGIPVGQ